jgi:hypothetical protein
MNLVFVVTVIQSRSLKAPFSILSAVESMIAFSQYRDDSRDEEQMVAQRDEPITVPVVTAEVNVVPVAEAVHEAEAIVEIAPKKRGRKPKVINATEIASQMGRPPLARDALTISPRITRSF